MICTLGMSWEAALEKNETLTNTDEGFWVSHQVNNNPLTSPPPSCPCRRGHKDPDWVDF